MMDKISYYLSKKALRKRITIVQVSPYPPEAGTDYHEQLAQKLAQKLKIPIIVLAGLNHLNPCEAMKHYGAIEKHDGIIVYRVFWAPRIIEHKKPITILKYIVSSLKALAQVIAIAHKHSEKIIVYFHYGPTTWPGGFLGEHYPLGMLLARLMGVNVYWTVHSFLTPHQLWSEARERRLPIPLILPLIAYYLLLAKIAGMASHRIIVLVDSPNAPITRYLSKLLGRSKVVEQVHPLFKPLIKLKRKPKDHIIITCLGYIRREKGYHILLKWLADLKNRNPSLYNKINVVIAGSIDRKITADIEYLKNLLRIKREQGLDKVKFIIKKLDEEEFQKLLAESTIVWCAYAKKYGPSGILAWARAFNVKALGYDTLWGNTDGSAPSFRDHVAELIQLIHNG